MARGLACLRGRPTLHALPFSARLPVTHVSCLPPGPSWWSDSLPPLLGSADSLPLPRTCPMEPKPLHSCPNPCIPAGLGHPPLCPLPQPGTELATGQGSAGSVEKQPKALECGVRPPPPTPQAELTVKAPGPSPLLGVSSGSRSALGGTAAALKEARACRHRLPPARAPIWVGRSSAHAECLQGGL